MTDWEKVSSPAVQDFIFKNTGTDERALVLHHKILFDLPTKLIAEQIAGRRKARKKLPVWYSTQGIIYPPSLNLEQSSSLATASFKASFLRSQTKQNTLIDLTGGFGVDSFFFSKEFDSVGYVEPDSALLTLVRHNHKLLGVQNIQYHNTTAEDFLSTEQTAGVFYLDPARRDVHAKKIFKFADCAPLITELVATLFSKADFVMVKASPLLDIQQGLRELPNTKTVLVVAVENEMKELLFFLQRNHSTSPQIIAIDLDSTGYPDFKFEFTQQQENCAQPLFSDPLKYLYEPGVAFLKAGAFKLVGRQLDLYKLDINTHLYTSAQVITGFPGRTLEILTINPTEKELRALPGRAVNIVTRNYPLKPEAIKKKFKLTDGGSFFLIGFSTHKKKYLALCRLISTE